MSKEHREWRWPTEGIRNHVATDGSLLGGDRKVEACGWSLVQLNYDGSGEPLFGAKDHQEVRADGLLMSPQKSERFHYGPRRQ